MGMGFGSFIGKHVLITGGTSGFGKSLAIQLKESAESVTVLGKNSRSVEGENLNFIPCDLADFNSVRRMVKHFSAMNLCFNFLINNAGILSPPRYNQTVDGFELSYQVNFLSHVLLTRLLFKHKLLHEPTIINVTSPIAKKGNLLNVQNIENSYSTLQAYADSKLFMILFNEMLAVEGIKGFSFNPGTFRSAIYRSQQGWFHFIYKIAAPFMISSEKVAACMIRIIDSGKYKNGKIINKNGAESSIAKFSDNDKKDFWEVVNEQLRTYLSGDND